MDIAQGEEKAINEGEMNVNPCETMVSLLLDAINEMGTTELTRPRLALVAASFGEPMQRPASGCAKCGQAEDSICLAIECIADLCDPESRAAIRRLLLAA